MSKMKLYREKPHVVYVTQYKDPFFTYITNKVFDEIDWNTKGRLLDLGCGSGRISLEAAKRGFSVVGVDYVPKAIEIANAEAKRVGLTRRVKFLVGDLARAKQRKYGLFDYVVLMEVIEHIEDYQKIINFAYGSLKKGGKLLLTTPNNQAPWTVLDDYARHVRRFTLGEVRTALSKFSKVKAGTVGYPLHRLFITLYNVIMRARRLQHNPKVFRWNKYVAQLYYIVGTLVLSFDNLFAYGEGGTTIVAIAEK